MKTIFKTRVLVVDNAPASVEAISGFLRSEGYDTAQANSGEAAMELLDRAEADGGPARPRRPFAVVLSELDLPGMSGMTLLERINAEHPRTAVVMLTGCGTIESAVQAMHMHASDFLTKPVVEDELRDALEHALEKKAGDSEEHVSEEEPGAVFGPDLSGRGVPLPMPVPNVHLSAPIPICLGCWSRPRTSGR